MGYNWFPLSSTLFFGRFNCHRLLNLDQLLAKLKLYFCPFALVQMKVNISQILGQKKAVNYLIG